jgi:hypothetical protein
MITHPDYCRQTNIDMSQAVRSNYQLPIVGLKNEVWYVKATDMFNQCWLDSMAESGVPGEWVLIFYRPAGFQHQAAHIDVYGTDTDSIAVSALNWIIGGRGSEMSWYQPPSEPFAISYTDRNIPYIQFPICNLEEKHRTNIGNGVTLVRVNVPHAIFVGDEPRWCISLRNHIRSSNWSEAVERLQNLGLLLD